MTLISARAPRAHVPRSIYHQVVEMASGINAAQAAATAKNSEIMMETMSSLALDSNVPSEVRAEAIKSMESHLQAERKQQGSGINVILLVVFILSLSA